MSLMSDCALFGCLNRCLLGYLGTSEAACMITDHASVSSLGSWVHARSQNGELIQHVFVLPATRGSEGKGWRQLKELLIDRLHA